MPPPDAGPDRVQMELEVCLAACKQAIGDRDRALLCANLVGKFGYHIADILGVPFLLLAPSLPPPGPLPSLATAGALLGPALRRRLREADEQEEGEADDDGDDSMLRYRRRSVGASELQHWMLSLLVVLDYRTFRRKYVVHIFIQTPATLNTNMHSNSS